MPAALACRGRLGHHQCTLFKKVQVAWEALEVLHRPVCTVSKGQGDR
jgi:hypothetical protein